MLTYTFDNIGDSSLYEYLYKCIKNDIIAGNLSAGEHLPSKRSFAKNLGVSTITIENAYGQLMSEGYIYSLPKRGYFVADISDIAKMKPAIVEKQPEPDTEKREFSADLSGSQTNPANFPFSVWAKLMRETISHRSRELMINSPSAGILPLRRAIAGHLRSFRGMNVDPNQIVVGAGTEYLYGVLIQLFGRDKRYCVENPGYSKVYRIYKANSVDCRYADMDSQGISVECLKRVGADIVHISPTHHFPTGITMPVNRRYELLAWANECEGRYIIEDDYDSEFRLDGKPIPSLKSIDISEKVVYINTFSKSLASTIRMSYMVLPVHLAREFYENLSFYSCTVSNFEQYTMASFIEGGHFEKHINRMRLFYSRRRSEVLGIIESSELSKKCSIIEADSGLHFLLRLDADISDDRIKHVLAEHGIHIAALSEYYMDAQREAEHTFVISYSNLDLEKLKEALNIISEST